MSPANSGRQRDQCVGPVAQHAGDDLAHLLPAVEVVEALEALLELVADVRARAGDADVEVLVDAHAAARLAAEDQWIRVDLDDWMHRRRPLCRRVGHLGGRDVGQGLRARLRGLRRRRIVDAVAHHVVGIGEQAHDREQHEGEHQHQARGAHVAAAPAGEVLARQEPGPEQQPEQRAPHPSVESDVAPRGLAHEPARVGELERGLLSARRAERARCVGAAVATRDVTRGAVVDGLACDRDGGASLPSATSERSDPASGFIAGARSAGRCAPGCRAGC